MRNLPWFLFLLCACVRNPATGKLQLDLIPESQEIEMGQQAKQEVIQTMGIYRDPKLEQYVADLGKPLAANSGRPNLPFSYMIVEDAAVNAFALPGGPIFITRGILGHLNSEAELVAVMGHETGHISARHSANMLSKAQLAQVGLGIASIVSPTMAQLAQVAGAGMQLLFLQFSRTDETQADEMGFRFMTKAGYDPRQMIGLFQMLGGLGVESAGGASAGKLPEWAQTHPIPEHRLEATQERLKTELKGDPSTLRVDREKYLSMIDGIPFGDDPRQGYFKGDTFLHPELKFQIELPKGWQHENTPQAVVAVSPQQDAMMQLASAGKLSPQEAAQKFFSQQGVKQGAAAQGTIHGSSAVSAYFAGTTQQGPIEGLATFLAHQGTTYAIFGYTAAGKEQSYDQTFRASMGSFATLSDSAALNVQPARVKVVHLDRAMSVKEFTGAYPSSVKPEVVALLNGVDKDGTLQAGPAKQIVGGVSAQK
ncbi:MAG: peptidase M48 [Deltaproteobacteria bacterium]|nr:MAG: peptidase M48 [Deltaproteobacteria bacterium]